MKLKLKEELNFEYFFTLRSSDKISLKKKKKKDKNLIQIFRADTVFINYLIFKVGKLSQKTN